MQAAPHHEHLSALRTAHRAAHDREVPDALHKDRATRKDPAARSVSAAAVADRFMTVRPDRPEVARK